MMTIPAFATPPASAPLNASGFQDIRTDVESPHFDWMDPAAETPPRVLFFCHRLYGRDVVEVLQRWPAEYAAVTYGGWREGRRAPTLGLPNYLAWRSIRETPETNEKTSGYILQRLQDEFVRKPAVMVVDDETWRLLDEEVWEQIWELVSDGMGLVYSRPPEEFLEELQSRGEELDEAPASGIHSAQSPLRRITAHKVGDGRVVTFQTLPRVGIRFLAPARSDETEFETAMAQVILCTQWASGQEELVSIRSVEAPKETIWPVGSDDKLQLTVDAASDRALLADVRLFDEKWREVGDRQEEIRLRAGSNDVTLALPAGTKGNLTAVVRLFDEDSIAAFGATSMEIASPTSVAVEATTELVPPGEPVEVRLTLEQVEPGDEVVLELSDHMGRMVGRQTVEATDGEHLVALDDKNPRSRHQRLQATLFRGNEVVARADATLVRSLPFDPLTFRHFTWRAYVDTFYVRNHLNHMRELGLNAAFQPGSGEDVNRNAIRHNLDLVSITHTAPKKRSDTQVLDLVSEEYFEENREKILNFMREAATVGGQWAYSHGDEIYIRGWDPKVRDVSQGPVRDAFVKYLQKSYNDDIAELNQAWETEFSSYDAMEVPENITEPSEPRAPWLDYSRFLIDAFCGYFERLNASTRDEFPDEIIAIDGIEQFSQFDGIDWYRLQNAHNGIIIYPHEDHDSKLYSWRSGLSFMPQHGFNGYWIAYDSDFIPQVAAGYPWRSLFVGLGSQGYFQAYDEADPYAAMYPDWRPRPSYEAVTTEVRRIQSGIDRLLLGAHREHSPIAVHYSQRSWALSFPSAGIESHINQLGNYNVQRIYRGYDGHVATNASAFLALLLDLGYQPQMMATEQIEAGALEGYKVLVLPYSQALTDGEVTAIREFVKNGGVLIADYRTGIRDGRGNLRPDGDGSLDDLFGIRQVVENPNAQLSEQPMTISSIIRRDERDQGGQLTMAMLSDRVERALIGGYIEMSENAQEAQLGRTHHNLAGIAQGEARDGTPVFLYNKIGEGAAIFLNFSLEPYLDARAAGEGGPYMGLLRDVFSELCHVELPVYVSQTSQGFQGRRAWTGLPEPGVEINLFKDGKAEYAGLTWGWKRPDWSEREVQARFITPSHLYDTLEGEYLGYTDRATFEVAGAVPVKLFTRLPYQVEKIDISASAPSVSPGDRVSFDASIVPVESMSPGRHVIRIAVVDETEQELEPEGAVLDAPEGRLEYTWQVPYNMALGDYELHFTDVATGVSSTSNLRIE